MTIFGKNSPENGSLPPTGSGPLTLEPAHQDRVREMSVRLFDLLEETGGETCPSSATGARSIPSGNLTGPRLQTVGDWPIVKG